MTVQTGNGYTLGTPPSAQVMVTDPTEVGLRRVAIGGSMGAVEECGAVAFRVGLIRTLVAGEIIDVPLSIGGTNVTTKDWSLALTPATGVTLHNETTATPLLRFSSASARGTNLRLTPTIDSADEGGTETFTIALGADGIAAGAFDHASRMTNVGGGTDPHTTANTFDIEVTDVNAGVTVTEIGADTQVAENGGTDTYTLVLDSQPTVNVTLAVTAGTGVTATPTSLTFTDSNWDTAQIVTVTGVNDDNDTADRRNNPHPRRHLHR